MDRIEKVAVLGAGVMGGTIAAHLANAGLEVLLLDVATPSLEALGKVKPAPFFLPSAAARIRVGTFAADAAALRDRD
ncbi:MAG TPA: 3-hydroxyacyl-CoA dehydrogenase NAD-binding domain-containing protein, partial [Anaeromyxobacteraceae bacterium]|nr:3-hydroxyacyl-CoA dehydrogenase NAD-binding domain-containing protein [Anaeromyxobacteraceae bacterium]